MAYRCREALLLIALVVLIGVVARPAAVRQLAHAQSSAPEFAAAEPARLYAGDFSHPGLAFAGPGPTNGYCVNVNTPQTVPAGGDRGFTVSAGSILSTAFYDNGT